MTPGQWEQIIVKVESAWGTSGKWRNPVAMYGKGDEDESRSRARYVDFAAAMKAVQAFIDEGGDYAPSIPKLLRLAVSFQPARKLDRSRCDHPGWGIVARSFDGDTVVCRVCGVEEQRPHDSLPTVGELEQVPL